MAPHNEEDDPAVYRSSVHKKSKMNTEPDHEASSSSSSPSKDVQKPGLDHDMDGEINFECANGHDEVAEDYEVVGDYEVMEANEVVEDSEDNEEEEEDSTLLTVQPGFNRLLLVLRDERVMRFVKYVSAAAVGSRWDVYGEYEVGMIQEEAAVGE